MNQIIAEVLGRHVLEGGAEDSLEEVALAWTRLRPFLCKVAEVAPETTIPPGELVALFVDGLDHLYAEKEACAAMCEGTIYAQLRAESQALRDREDALHIPLWQAAQKAGLAASDRGVSLSGLEEACTRLESFTAFAALVQNPH